MKERLYKIDLFRFIAALSVVLYHYTFRGYADNMSKLSFPFLGKIFQNGYLGVDLFFIISGFVILMSAENATLKEFFKSRIARLYPAFWISASLTAFVMVIFNDVNFIVKPIQYVLNLSMLNGFIGVKHIDGVYWSLTKEIQFYGMISIFLYFKKIKTYIFEIFIYAWLLISYSTLFINYDSHAILKLIKFIFILDFSSYFIAGMIFFKIYQYGNNVLKSTTILTCCLLSILLATKRTLLLNIAFSTHFSITQTACVIILIYAFIFLISLHQLNFLNKELFLKFGLITYPLYLIHQNIGFILFNYFGSIINKHLILFLVFCIMVITSFAINKFVEKPLSKFIKSKLNAWMN